MSARDRVLVDTSVWIDFLRGIAEAVELLHRLRASHQVAICGTVRQEVLQCARNAKAFQRLEREMSIWDYEAEHPQDFVDAARTYSALRWKGVTVPASDCLIAAVAVRAGLRVSATDPHFSDIPGVMLVAP